MNMTTKIVDGMPIECDGDYRIVNANGGQQYIAGHGELIMVNKGSNAEGLLRLLRAGNTPEELNAWTEAHIKSGAWRNPSSDSEQ
jgi:hypothetical protein